MVTTVSRLSGAALPLTIDGSEYKAEITSWELSEEEKDSKIVTFGDASAAQAKLKVGFVQSLAAESLHQKVYDNPGKRDVPFKLAPSGNTTPAANNPVFEGTLHFPKLRPTISMEAKSDGGTADIEFTIAAMTKNTGTAREE